MSEESSQAGRREETGERSSFPLRTWALLFGVWVLLSGKIDAFHLGVGLVVVALLAWMQRGLPALRGPGSSVLRSFRVITYSGWLLAQMVKSALYVAQVVLLKRDEVDPQLIAFRSPQPSTLTAVVFANSITLTPGTLTVDLVGDRYVVHALTPATAKDVMDGEMARRVARLSSDEPISPPESIPVPEFREHP